MGSHWIELVQLTINGIAIGSIYSLVALGLVLGYKATEVLNFAHGDIVMASAFVGWAFIAGADISFWLALPLTMLAVAALSYLLEARFMRLIAGQPQFAGVMLTIGLGFMLRGVVSMVVGPDAQSYSTPWTGRTVQWGQVVVAELNLVILAAAVVVMLGLYFFLKKTAVGVAIQSASQNQLAAYLVGVPVKRVNSMVWAIAGAVAALCGLLLAPITLVDISLWFVVLKALAALVLGGFGSVSGAVLGGLLIGLVEQFAGRYLPDGTKDVTAYLILVGVLVFFPRGILGESHGRRV
jgi:branched-chain amino acid transport system permease protein